jgi:hypothetical protein
VAAPASKVIIDGEAFPIPEIVRNAWFHGAFAAISPASSTWRANRSGSRQLRVVRYPRSLARGEQWVYETDEGRKIHEIDSVEADGRITIASRDSSHQTIRGAATSGGFVFTDVEVRSPRRQGAGARLKITDDGRFAIGVNALGEAVSGSAVRGAEPESSCGLISPHGLSIAPFVFVGSWPRHTSPRDYVRLAG